MNIEELEQIAESVRLENSKFDHEINVCMGTRLLKPALGPTERTRWPRL